MSQPDASTGPHPRDLIVYTVMHGCEDLPEGKWAIQRFSTREKAILQPTAWWVGDSLEEARAILDGLGAVYWQPRFVTDPPQIVEVWL